MYLITKCNINAWIARITDDRALVDFRYLGTSDEPNPFNGLPSGNFLIIENKKASYGIVSKKRESIRIVELGGVVTDDPRVEMFYTEVPWYLVDLPRIHLSRQRLLDGKRFIPYWKIEITEDETDPFLANRFALFSGVI